MDTSAADITFDAEGRCSYCSEFLDRSAARPSPGDSKSKREALESLVETVKAAGRGKRYDCIVGVSGGVDSSWALVQAVKLGLRPLAVHMDNGWNSELAQSNIANLVRRLGVDLYTHVIDWDEYRGLMDSFFAADVIDVELLYDNAMLAVNFQQAGRYGLRFILSGSNQATEGMRMPGEWVWFKYDKRNIKALARRFGPTRLRTYPSIGSLRRAWNTYVRRAHWIPFLDYLDYTKAQALIELERDYQYKAYLYKHYESVFTRFYQGYILPRKFGIDKRRLHLSTLIATGQMTRAEALDDLNRIPYPSEAALLEDEAYFLKKMGWTKERLERYLGRPNVPHYRYRNERRLAERISGAVGCLARIYRTIRIS